MTSKKKRRDELGADQRYAAEEASEHDKICAHVRQLLSTKKLDFEDFEYRATVGTGTFGRVRLVAEGGRRQADRRC